jgi:cytochrome P450
MLPRELPTAGIRGREVVVEAMRHYFTSKAYLQGSGVVRSRYTTVSHDETEDDMARSETVNGIAILANSVPTAFWTIFHIFSDPALLATVRKQVEQITTASLDGKVKSINLRKLKDGHAPIIFSVIQETLRHRATGTGPRMIMEDIRVGEDGYLLKKGSFVIIANKALHFSETEWGSSVSEFRADRFTSKTPGHAFRGFGGGANLCPGRNFAMFEVGAMVAMLVSRFDVEPVGSGGWRDPGQNVTNMSLQIAPPNSKVVVDLVERSEPKDWIWNFEI